MVETALEHLGWVGVCPEGGKQGCLSRSGAPGGAGRGGVSVGVGVGVGVSVSRAAGAVCPGGGVAGRLLRTTEKGIDLGLWWVPVVILCASPGESGDRRQEGRACTKSSSAQGCWKQGCSCCRRSCRWRCWSTKLQSVACLCALPSSPPVS